jgi:hypothetical protein
VALFLSARAGQDPFKPGFRNSGLFNLDSVCVQEEEEEESTPKPSSSKRGRKSKSAAGSDAAVPTPKEASPEQQAMPTVAQLCEQYALKDVDLEYSEADYSNLTTYKLFLQTFRWDQLFLSVLFVKRPITCVLKLILILNFKGVLCLRAL